MQTETKYGVIKAKQSVFPIRKLLVVPHRDGDLTVSYPAFGPNYFKNNITEMQKSYSHPKTGKRISFREPTTSESISAAAYRFDSKGEVDAKRDIFDPRWLQLGYIVRTSEGVFTNTRETDEKILKSYLDRAEKVNGIYLINGNAAFAPYETFKQEVQDSDSFAETGLARLLEHTKEETARNLRKIASLKFYKNRVYVWGFDSVKEPILRVASLGSGWDLGSVGLIVAGYDWDDDRYGYAFGVLKGAEGTAQKNK